MSYLTDSCADVTDFEGCVPYLYLDSDKPPNATTGVGYLVASLAVSQTLPWQTSAGDPATADQIADDWARVTSIPSGNYAAGHYQSPNGLVLARADIDALTLATLQRLDGQLRTLLAGYDSFPDPAKLALLDMAYNLGIGRAAHNGLGATGLQEYAHCLAAIAAAPPDWNTAALDCGRNMHLPAFARRNAWTAAQFQAAAQATVQVAQNAGAQNVISQNAAALSSAAS